MKALLATLLLLAAGCSHLQAAPPLPRPATPEQVEELVHALHQNHLAKRRPFIFAIIEDGQKQEGDGEVDWERGRGEIRTPGRIITWTGEHILEDGRPVTPQPADDTLHLLALFTARLATPTPDNPLLVQQNHEPTARQLGKKTEINIPPNLTLLIEGGRITSARIEQQSRTVEVTFAS